MSEDRYEKLQRAIVERQPMIPPPHFEAAVGDDVKGAFLGRPVRTLQDDVDFWSEAGYCLVPTRFGLDLLYGRQLTTKAANIGHAHYSIYRNEEVEMSWSETGVGVIASDADFENFQWPSPEQADLAILDQIQPLLPHGMKVLANIGKVFTGTWQLMGFTGFCEALEDNPGLVARVFARVAEIQTRIFDRVVVHPAVGAVLHADDVAYCSGTMINPEILRRHLYPHYKAMGDTCRRLGKIYLYHSDGDVRSVIPDVIACGFHGLHPLEPKPLNGVEVKRRWGDQICLLGHVDVDLLARGTPQEVRDQTRRNLDNLARSGGYCPGAANSVPDYVPVENYLAMLEAIRSWS